jgi:hypothetical protein
MIISKITKVIARTGTVTWREGEEAEIVWNICTLR